MDFDADGNQDIISGSWPGELYLFRGLGQGQFAKATKINDKSGKPIKLGSASTVFVCDFQGTGRLDLLVGDIRGNVHLVKNEGTRKEPVYGKAVFVKLGKTRLVVGGDSHPIFVDWQNTGKPGLLVGASDGSVSWYPNVGSRKDPKFAKRTVLVPKGSYGWESTKGKKTDFRRGTRSKICVVDWNRDGKLDLLVGDYSSTQIARKLTPAQAKKKAKLSAELAELKTKLQSFYKSLSKGLREERKKLSEAKTPEARKKAMAVYTAKYQELSKSHAKEFQRRTKIYQQMRQFMGRYVSHGRVWLYLRKGTPVSAE
ncbi:MAG: FG-GAP-like repeat-containing protein [Gemmataceae bacterium]